MKVDRDTLDKIAHLSRLEFEEKDAEKMMSDMTNIINWVEKLNEVDTDNIEPLTTMSHEVNAFREDKVKGHIEKQKALSSAPDSTDNFFTVPKVLE